MRSEYTPANTIITFDLHGVLFTTDYKALFWRAWHSKYKARIIWHALRPTLWHACFNLWRQSSPVEKYLVSLIHQWPALAPCRQELIAIANAQKPNIAMIDLVRTLKKQGYQLHIFSNIGSIILADLQQHFPDIFSLFDHAFTTSAAIGYPSKRNSAFFQAYLISHPTIVNKKIVFIDDSGKNIEMGAKYGIMGIRARNVHHVRSALKTLGIPL